MYRIRGMQAVEQQVARDGRYIDPLSTIPYIEEPGLDTTFRGQVPQMISRVKSLVELAQASIIEAGATSATTDYWLAIARQNIRNPIIGEVYYSDEARGTLSLIGLKAIYLADKHLRDSAEAYVYTARAAQASREIESGNRSTRPQNNPFKDTLDELDVIDSTGLDAKAYAAIVGERIGIKQHSPELARAKAFALFDYASTMVDCPEKKDLLNESIVYANHALAATNDDAMKGTILRVLASAIHDISYLPGAFSDDTEQNAELVVNARGYAITLLQASAAKLEQALCSGENSTEVQAVLADVRYFEYLYARHATQFDAHTPDTQAVCTHIARETAHKFGTKAVMYIHTESGQMLAA